MRLIHLRLAAAITATLVAGGIACMVWRAAAEPRSSVVVTVAPGTTDEQTWNDREPYVVDDVAGFRPRRSSTWRHPMTALGADHADAIVKHRDAHGFLREHELPTTLTHRPVLVVGDSHVDGVVSTEDSFTTLLEARLAETDEPCQVLNAGCGFYSLWQYVLRASDLAPKFRPRVTVVVVFLGNDFLDLDNPTFPHLDDDLRELPPGKLSNPEKTTGRQSDLGLPKTHEFLFWQGMNQALYFHRDQDRVAAVMRKADYAVTTMARRASETGTEVLWVLLPSYDLVFPERTRALSPLAKEVVDGGMQRRLRDAFTAVLAAHAAKVLDAEPAFRGDGREDLFAIDFHIYRRAHGILAALLLDPVLEALRKH